MDYREQYQNTFATLGYPLGADDALPEAEIAAAEDRLGVRLPSALRDYYLVAGNERRFNTAYQRLYAPEDWRLYAGKLIFMEENQAVVFWGTVASSDSGDDPPVYQAVNEESAEWFPVQERCSVFLQVMLHMQGTWAAMQWAADAMVSPELVTHLDRHWNFVGEVLEMRAYNRPGQAICVLPWEDSWRAFAGTRLEPDLDALSADLGLEWENVGETID